VRVLVASIVAVSVGISCGCRRAAPPPTPAAPPAASAAGSSATESVAGFPDYPGASRVAFSQRGPSEEYTRKVAARFITADPFPAVRTFYQNAVASGGWTVVKLEEEADEVSWRLVRGTVEAKVKVEAERPGRVSIQLERKER